MLPLFTIPLLIAQDLNNHPISEKRVGMPWMGVDEIFGSPAKLQAENQVGLSKLYDVA